MVQQDMVTDDVSAAVAKQQADPFVKPAYPSQNANGSVPPAFVCKGKFKLDRTIGTGNYGTVFAGRLVKTGEEVAIKLEPVKASSQQLLYEAQLSKVLGGKSGIPKVYWHGVDGHYNVMVMELLGASLEQLLTSCGRRMSLTTVLMIGDQLLERLERIHSKGFVHRDIKPENFLFGRGKNGRIIYAIDFGLARPWRDMKRNVHVPYEEGKKLAGTARFASLSTHLGIKQSRRDDVEAVAYLLLYLRRGQLPWQGLGAAEGASQKYEKIMDMKMSMKLEELCRGEPSEFVTLLKYCRSLSYEEQPDYAYIRRLFRKLLQKGKQDLNLLAFDWEVTKESAAVDVPNAELALINETSALIPDLSLENTPVGASLSQAANESSQADVLQAQTLLVKEAAVPLADQSEENMPPAALSQAVQAERQDVENAGNEAIALQTETQGQTFAEKLAEITNRAKKAAAAKELEVQQHVTQVGDAASTIHHQLPLRQDVLSAVPTVSYQCQRHFPILAFAFLSCESTCRSWAPIHIME
eukprot:TRINITY_DN12732_c0_g1_i2.p1 TRINITY_DN12732_c0_g1~~TRINITY_DN12732_c0_g1_i2.p1  ORF type:complete len:526 (+),score=123.02 TRINITY_DN12732_c0_g1_i2:108-1685(+)